MQRRASGWTGVGPFCSPSSGYDRSFVYRVDTASLEIDDTDGRIILPQIGATVVVALGWEGETFDADQLRWTREWLRSKANSIEGGTTEVQLNIIAKRVLGLPD